MPANTALFISPPLPVSLGGTGLTSAPNGLVNGNGSTTYSAATAWTDYTPKIPLTQSNINSSSQLIAVNTETVIDFRGTVQDDSSWAHPPYYQVDANGWYRVTLASSGDGADWRFFVYKNVGGTLSGSNPTTISGGTSTLIGRLRDGSSDPTNSETRSIDLKLSASDILYTTVKQTAAGGGVFLYYDSNNGTKITIERIQ